MSSPGLVPIDCKSSTLLFTPPRHLFEKRLVFKIILKLSEKVVRKFVLFFCKG